MDDDGSKPIRQQDEDPTETSDSTPGTTPRQIGPYRLLEKLGEGGMGAVWLAQQTEPVRRKVALKIIKHGMDTKHVVARFEAERQALALMDHPCVAKVFDAGSTAEGRPYFAMEYVKGVPITEHCDRQNLTTRERLELFMQVCEGVQHAHRKAIIHRDLKPSNVLISYQDAKAMPKIIDFGVAKAIEHRLTERTLFTETGVLLGTPEYMSPEQAEMTCQDVDTRTDVYSLGVMLYELLAGVLPFESRALREAGFDGLRRKIREETPSKPSTRVRTLSAELSAASALRRGTDPPSLLRQLEGDLDWITMRALEKDRTRRYGAPAELAADLRRHLDHRPVLARPPGLSYRAGRWIRRNKSWAVAATLVTVALAVAVTAVVVQRLRARATTERTLRWTLEQVIATGEYPSHTLAQSWGTLDARLREALSRAPKGDLALLAHRAAARVNVDVPSFGLLSDPPAIDIEYGRFETAGLFLPNQQFVWIAELEFSWDGGPWEMLGEGSWTHLRIQLDTKPFEEIVPQLEAGPHRIRFRAHLRLFDHVDLSTDEVIVVHTSERLAGMQAFHSETRDLGEYSVSFFEEYPADFPTAVVLEDPVQSVEGWLRVRGVRLVVVRVPEGSGRCLSFVWPGEEEHDTETTCPARAVQPLSRLVAGFELEGSFGLDSHTLPVASRAVLSIPGGGQVLSFELAFPVGPEIVSLGSSWDCYWFMNSDARPDGYESWLTGIRGRLSDDHAGPLPVLSRTPTDSEVSGVLELFPSRSVALATRRFDRYLGSAVSIPVDVVIAEVEGSWTNDAP